MLGRSVWELQKKSKQREAMTFTTPHNPNNEPLAFCVLLSHNNMSTNSHPRYAQPLGVGVNEEQTEGSDDIVKCPLLSPPNPNHEAAFLSYNNL